MRAGHVTAVHSARSVTPALGCALQTRLEQATQGKPWSPLKAAPKKGTQRPPTTARRSVFPTGRPSLPGDRAGVFQQSILLHTGSDHGAVAGSGACTDECEPGNA